MFEVYVHVPFCLRRCGYCDFNTYTATDLGQGASRGNYATQAIREMRLVRDWQTAHGIHEPPASSVFLGGGTPTILPAADLARMVDAVRDLWGLTTDAEITTEANPDTVDADYVRALADAGFTRISFGMQSAVPHVLRILERTHTPANVAAGVRAAQAAGLRVSVDLIYGAPGESLDDWHTSVETALALGVEHLSAYALTVEPETKMGRKIAAGTLRAPDDDDEAAKYQIVDELCRKAGLAWYEISNWAVPGQESRHNLGYWRNIDWAGIGPGAHSHYAQTGEDGVRAWDTLHPRAWSAAINDGRIPWAGSERIDKAADLEERIMLGLRLHEGLDLADIEHRAGRDLHALADALEREGLAAMTPSGRMVATLRGRLLNDTVIERIFDAVL
ncbi:radical SAM family heme chaperone HemW [Bifidobacterium cuniculi]|uniref:Heme chaperone HemW n=1 Tax=Bifidobacterium cuniculi TaxID=1688 RepID=A0A087B4L2_9BIFI|nr:radical SAM family heme chaperone HemW [Bifidobacterium cuniculi]KFI65962.1 oxygen-independent coproporphyrinogen III oxidase [Bifidobacterium cuniculi]